MELSLFAVASWVLALVYHHYSKDMKAMIPKNSLGLKEVIRFVAQFAVMIFIIGLISGALSFSDNPKSNDPTLPAAPLWPHWSISLPIAILAFLVWTLFTAELNKFICHLLNGKNSLLETPILLISNLLILFLIGIQVISPNKITNNIFMFFVALMVVPFAMALKRSGVLSLFSLLMLLDVYLVWMASVGTGSGEANKQSWYITMIDSELMRHWPFPIGFIWGQHIIGNGDIFFMGIGAVYAKQVSGNRAAILSGIAMTAPILLLGWVKEIWPNMPSAWPYTIFIAPIAILVALLSKKSNI